MTTEMQPEQPDHSPACGWSRSQARMRLANEAVAAMEDQGVDCVVNALYICPSTERVVAEITAAVGAPWHSSGDDSELWDDTYRTDEAEARKTEAALITATAPVSGGKAYTAKEAEAFFHGQAARRSGVSGPGGWEACGLDAFAGEDSSPGALLAAYTDGWNATDVTIAAARAEYEGRTFGEAS